MSIASRLIVFTDLDDTLFQSVKGEVSSDAIEATVDVDGKPYAYSSIQQQKLLSVMVKADATIIPVTGRRTSSFLNCRLPDVMNSEYAIVSHGAVILDKQRVVLKEWREFLTTTYSLANWEKQLTSLYQKLYDYFIEDQNVRVRLIIDQGITAYICIKINKVGYLPEKSKQLSKLLNSELKTGMLLHGNGRNFALLAPYAQKKVAVSFLKAKLDINESDTVFAIGDSDSDLPFMKDANFLIIPQQAQILKGEAGK